MNDDEDRWRRVEPPKRGPSAPPNLRFDPVATALGVWAAIAIPVTVVGYTRQSGPNGTIILVGVLAGLLVGLIAGICVAYRDGRIWRGPQL